MPQLLGPDGRPISTAILNKKADPPKTGNAFGAWAGRDITYASLPGGGVVQFDLSKLTTSDFRNMRDHYQVNSSLAVLSFMQHQSDFHVECDDKKIASFCDDQLHESWTMLNRAMAQANWAGYSPNALEWENNILTQKVDLAKIKDLIPEECTVNWKQEEGWSPPGHIPPKFYVYDGIKQFATRWPIPVENSFWYPLLMENGDYYGRKLLRPAFTSWYFSLLVHLFANRYYERFGEPTPIGRAPFEEEIDVGGDQPVRGADYMLNILTNLRNRSVVVLPNDRTDMSSTGHMSSHPTYDYDIEYLESQMRGADFERYLTRLDEEISLGLFTPILLMRTADVGSYNLGVGHMQMYLWMLNAMNDDRKFYIDRYILSPLVDYNFSPNAPRAKIVFGKLGKAAADVLKEVLVALIQGGRAVPDLDELGQMAGLTLKEIRQTTAPTPDPGSTDPTAPGQGGDGGTGSGTGGNGPANITEARATVREILNRVRPQVENAFRDHTFGPDLKISMGYKRKFEKALEADGLYNSAKATENFYGKMDYWLNEVVSLGESEFSSAEAFMSLFNRVVDVELERIAG